MDEIISRLYAMQDAQYRAFNAGLVPLGGDKKMIGVRTPELRRLARELSGTPQAAALMAAAPHEYFELDQLHAFLIAEMRDFDACLDALEEFLPHVDNWATCDQLNPRVLGRHKAALLPRIRAWLASGRCYTVCFAIGQLMRWYLDADFSEEYLDMVCAVKSEEYYVRMMIAWYFATALAKQYDAALPYIAAGRLDTWTHNKAIQKARESLRVPQAHKDALSALKIKNA